MRLPSSDTNDFRDIIKFRILKLNGMGIFNPFKFFSRIFSYVLFNSKFVLIFRKSPVSISMLFKFFILFFFSPPVNLFSKSKLQLVR